MSASLKNNLTYKTSVGYVFISVVSVIAVAFAIAGQFSFSFLQNRLAAAIFLAASLILWGVVVLASADLHSSRLDDLDHPRTPRRKVALSLAGGGIALAILTFFASSGNSFNSDNVLSWILSIVLFAYAFWEPEKNWSDWREAIRERIADWRSAARYGIRVRWNVVFFIAVLLLGAFSFYYRLSEVPAEMTADHAEKLLDVDDVLRGARPIFLVRNTGREPLQFYLTAALMNLTDEPLGFMALKWVTASLGLAIVVFTYFLAREMFDDWVGLIAAALTAVSSWLMIIARIGLRFPLTPFFATPLVFFLFRALKYQKRNDFMMLGLVLGLGLYGYNAFRIAPLLVAVCFLVWPLLEHNVRKRDLRAYLINISLAVLLSVIVFMPMLRYMFDDPSLFWYRTLSRVSGSEQSIASHPLRVFADNVKNVLFMFNVRGDTAWPNNIPKEPALDFMMGGLFILGIVTAVYRLVRFRETMVAHLLLVFMILLLPSALALAFPVENPGNARAGGAIPFAMIIVALPLALIARAIQSSMRARLVANVATVGVIGAIILLIASANYYRYFVKYDESYRELSWNSSEVAATVRAFANSVGDTEHAWIMLYPHWVDTRNVAINLGELSWQDHTLPDAEAAEPHTRDPAHKLYVLNPNDADNLARLQELFPDGQLRTFHARTLGHDFLLWYVPGTETPRRIIGNVP